MNYLDIFKTAVATSISALVASLQPVHNAMLLLLIFAGCDILFGVLSGIIASKERFSFKKFMLSAGYLLVYLGIVVMVYAVGKYQGDLEESLYVVKVITYVFIYFYSSNILKNLHQLMPDNPVIKFLDYFIGLEFTKKITILEDFLKKNSAAEGEDTDGGEDGEEPADEEISLTAAATDNVAEDTK